MYNILLLYHTFPTLGFFQVLMLPLTILFAVLLPFFVTFLIPLLSTSHSVTQFHTTIPHTPTIMPNPIHLLILETDKPLPGAESANGSYADVFTNLFQRVAKEENTSIETTAFCNILSLYTELSTKLIWNMKQAYVQTMKRNSQHTNNSPPQMQYSLVDRNQTLTGMTHGCLNSCNSLKVPSPTHLSLQKHTQHETRRIRATPTSETKRRVLWPSNHRTCSRRQDDSRRKMGTITYRN